MAWFLTRSGVNFLYHAWFAFRKLPGIQYTREALPVVVAVAVFLILYMLPRVNIVLDEAISELKKVTWPNYPDVVKATGVVMMCIVIASLILSSFDLIFGRLIQWALHSL